MRRQVLKSHAMMFELAHERRIVDERRNQDDLIRCVRVEQAVDQARPQDAAG